MFKDRFHPKLPKELLMTVILYGVSVSSDSRNIKQTRLWSGIFRNGWLTAHLPRKRWNSVTKFQSWEKQHVVFPLVCSLCCTFVLGDHKNGWTQLESMLRRFRKSVIFLFLSFPVWLMQDVFSFLSSLCCPLGLPFFKNAYLSYPSVTNRPITWLHRANNPAEHAGSNLNSSWDSWKLLDKMDKTFIKVELLEVILLHKSLLLFPNPTFTKKKKLFNFFKS